ALPTRRVSPFLPYTTLFRSCHDRDWRLGGAPVHPPCAWSSAVHQERGLCPEHTVTRGVEHADHPAACAAQRHARVDRSGNHHDRSEEHTSELQSRENLVCRL